MIETEATILPVPAPPVVPPVPEPPTPVPPAEPAPWVAWLACAYNATKQAIVGIRTFLFFAVTFVLSAAQELGMIDITPLIELFLPAGSKVSTSQAMLLISVVGIVLRTVTKTEMFASWQASLGTRRVDPPKGE